MKSKYWFTISLILAASVSVVGMAPLPMAVVGAVCLIGAFIFTGYVYGQMQWSKIKDGQTNSPGLAFAAVIVMTIALFFRSSELAIYFVPPLSVAAGIGCYFWMKRKEVYMQPKNSATE